jgi:hypothetical protein
MAILAGLEEDEERVEDKEEEEEEEEEEEDEEDEDDEEEGLRLGEGAELGAAGSLDFAMTT